MTTNMIENIQHTQLKKYAKQELINGLTPLHYKLTEEIEELYFQGVGDIDYLLWYDKSVDAVCESHILRSTGEKINFSDMNQDTNADISYYLRRDYRFIEIDDLQNPTYVLLYNIESYNEFLELSYDPTFNRLNSQCYDMEKLNKFQTFLRKTMHA